MRHRSDTDLRAVSLADDAFPVHHDADHDDNARGVLALGTAPPRSHIADRHRAPKHVGDVQDRASTSTAAPMHFEPLSRLPWLAAFGSIDPLKPSASLRSRRPVQSSPITGLHIAPRTCVRASACASASLLRTTPFGTSRTLRHSIAVAAPVRRILRRPFPIACTSGFVLLTACAGFGPHTCRS